MNITSLFRLLITVMILTGIPLTANACSCGDSEPDEYLAGTDLIFKGKVLSVEPIPSPDGMPPIAKRAKFKVLVSYKGAALETVEIQYVTESASCGWGFTEGKEVTVFAYGNSQKGFRTNMCAMIPYAHAMSHNDMTFQSAIETYRAKRAALLKAPVTVKRLREQAEFFIKYHDYDDAEAAFNKLLAKQPKDIAALMGRADVRYQLKRYEQALADYRTVIGLEANHQAARHSKTLSLLKLGRINELEPQDKDFSGYKQDNDNKLSFAGLDLTGANFSHTSFRDVDFSGANLSNADFSEANVESCNFTNTKLFQAKFYKGRLGSVRFDNAVLDLADFSNAYIANFFDKVTSMQDTKFVGTSFIKAKLKGMKFDGHDFSNADFRAADLRDTRFSNSQFNGATFGTLYHTADLRGADLSAANLTGVKWDGHILIDCRTKFPKDYDITPISIVLSWAGCEGVAPKNNLASSKDMSLHDIDAPNSNFSDLNILGIEFLSGHFDGSNFSNATLKQIMFGNGSYQNTNFENAKLTNVRLYNVNFSGASFAHAELSNVSLKEVDFTNANFDGAVMTNVVFDEKTKWPSGFDPLAAGAKKDK